MNDPDNRSFWQRFARLYAFAMKSSAGLYRQIQAKIAPSLTSSMDVLELACGSGQLSFLLASGVRSWYATDFSFAMIDEARKHKDCPDNLSFSVQDATSLLYADHSFDAVVISNALHVMPYPGKALIQIHRVLKPNGTLFAPTFVHAESAGFLLRVWLLERMGFHSFYKWNEREFVSFLNDNGFRVKKHCVLGGSLAPLCYAEARPKAEESI